MKINKDKLYQTYCQPDRLWTGGKAIKELHKIMSMLKEDIKPWLAKQALFLASSYTTSKRNTSSSL